MIVWEDDADGWPWPALVRWAVVGLAVLGVLGVVIWRALSG